MKYVVTITGITLLMFFMGCGDDWVTPGEFSIQEAEYTSVDTAKITYKAEFKPGGTSLWSQGVKIYNKDYTRTYDYSYSQGDYEIVGRSRFCVTVTVTPPWEPGDHVTVSAPGGGVAEFDVPPAAE